MRLRWRTIGLVLAAACRGAEPSATPDVVAVPDAAPSTPPPFLALDADLDALHPLRVRMIRAGALRLERAGEPVNDPSNRTTDVVARLLEADDFGTPPLPRILCEHEGHRIAVYVERDDLAIVTVRTVQVTTTPPREQTSGALPPGAPGVVLRAGTAVRVDGGLDGDITRVRYERTGIRVAGFVRRGDVGIGFAPDELATRPTADARLLGPTTFLNAPGGRILADVDPSRGLDTRPVKLLGIERSGHVMVQYSNGEITLVGWVPARSIERGAQSMTIASSYQHSGDSTPSLRRGTLLRGGPLRHAVGVATEDTWFDTTEPLGVFACTDVVEIVTD